MRLLMTTIGTRGDVQPFVALGRGLQAAGHEVTVATHPLFEDFIREQGLDFAPLEADPRTAMQENVAEMGANPFKLSDWVRRHATPLAHRLAENILEAAQGKDAILFSTLTFFSYHVAESLGIESLALYLQPITPTRAFPAVSLNMPPDWMPFRGAFNWWSTKLTNQILFAMLRGTMNDVRCKLLGMPPVSALEFSRIDTSDAPILYGYSSSVLPHPDDWGPHLHVTGYWFLDEPTWQPSAELVDFIAAGPPPVYVGFGSMTAEDARETTALVVEALEGQRAILLGGWAQLGGSDLPDNFLLIDSAPHGWLFRQMGAVVHHGGAGTTAAAFRSGVPQVVVPHFADQPFWGRRVAYLGAGPDPIMRRRLTAAKLRRAVRAALTDEKMRAVAADLGERIRAEDGVREAITVIERLFIAGESQG